MFETTSDLSFKDHQSELVGASSQQFSLPAITKKPASRGQLTGRKTEKEKQKFVLPSIYTSEREINSTQDLELDKQNIQNVNKTAFAREVKEKLNMVLGEMPPMESLENDDYDSEDSDFEAKIHENKEIIKQHRLKREGGQIFQSQQDAKNINASEAKAKKPPKLRNQSLYQKRVKQYKDQSIENKYLQRRKQTMKQKTPNQKSHTAAKQIKIKQDINIGKQQKMEIKRSLSKRNQPRVLSHKASQKNLIQVNKSINLFDGIQNYLQNPRERKQQQSQKQLVGLTLLKAKRDIQDKIKAMNEKLGLTEHQQKQQQTQTIQMNASAREWRRIQFKHLNVNYQHSNFDKELDRISSLQQKNSLCLQKYLQHQKILLELELRKKQLPRKLHISSK